MLRRLTFLFAVACALLGAPCASLVAPAQAQNVICSTAPLGDSSNKCASTAFVQNSLSSQLPLPSGQIFIGSLANLATAQTMTGDCSISVIGVITCTKTNNVPFAASATTDTTTQANVAFTGLSAAAAAADADTFPTNQGAGNLKQTLAAIKTWIQSWLSTVSRLILPSATFYVDDINGNNANTCRSATTGACKTLNGVVAKIGAFDLNWQAVTVNVAAPASSYSGMSCLQPWVGRGSVTFVGNTTTPTSVLVAGGASPAFDIENGCSVILQGFSATSTGSQSIQAINGGIIIASAMDLGAAASGATVLYSTRQSSYFEVNDTIGPITIHTGTTSLGLGQGSHTGEFRVNCSTACLKLTANVTYTQYVLLADGGAVIGTPSASFNPNGFAVTGNKYKAISQGTVQWNGNAPPNEADIPGTASSGVYCFGSAQTGPTICMFGSAGSATSFPIIYGGANGVIFQKQDGSANTFIVDNAGNPSFPLAPLPVGSGGTGVTSGTAFLQTAPVTVDFSVAGDNAITIQLPSGFTKFTSAAVMIGGASADISAATFGIFTTTGGGGTAILPAGTAITVTASAINTNNNAQLTNVSNVLTEAYTPVGGTIQFRVGATAAAGRTAKVSLRFDPSP